MNNRKCLTIGWMLIVLFVSAAHAMEEESVAERRRRVEAMSASEKEQLKQKQENFVSLSQAEQDRIRRLHGELATSEDGDELRGVLERYHAWLSTLSSAEKAELLSLPPHKRIERIKAVIQKQEDERFESEVKDKLRREDREAIMKWLLAFVDAHKQEIVDTLPEDRRPPQIDRWPLMFVLLRGWGDGNLDMPRPNTEDVEKLISELSPQAQTTLKNEREPQKRMEVARKWIQAAVTTRSWRSPPPVSAEELRKFYSELSAIERERLEALPREEMQRWLQRRYLEQKFRERGGSGFGPGGPGRGPSEGDRDRRNGRGGRGPGEFGKDRKGPPPPPPGESDDRKDSGKN